MSDRHVRWSSFIGEHHYVAHIYYMIHARPFGLCVPRPYLYMLGSSSLSRVFRVCNCFAPVVFERRAYHTRSSRGVSAQRSFATVHTQGEHFLIISERSSYNATVVLSKIRCIKGLTSHAINISDMIWPSSSCACDLHLRSTVMITIVTGATP